MHNIGEKPQSLPVGSRIAQLILEQISRATITTTTEPKDTTRGTQGVGSTGTSSLPSTPMKTIPSSQTPSHSHAISHENDEIAALIIHQLQQKNL